MKQPASSLETAGTASSRNKQPAGKLAAGAGCYLCVFPRQLAGIQQDVHKCSVRGFLEQQMLPTAGVLQALGTTHALSPGCGPRPDPHHPGPAQGGKWRGITDQIATHRNKGDFLLPESSRVTTHWCFIKVQIFTHTPKKGNWEIQKLREQLKRHLLWAPLEMVSIWATGWRQGQSFPLNC